MQIRASEGRILEKKGILEAIASSEGHDFKKAPSSGRYPFEMKPLAFSDIDEH